MAPTSLDNLARKRPGFTLAEILVVVGIIVLVLALAYPLFGVLTGSRSTEAGENQVAAALGAARSYAVNSGAPAGVLFYVDPATERSVMRIVRLTRGAAGEEIDNDDRDRLEKYKAWSPGVDYRDGDPTTAGDAPPADRVIRLAVDVANQGRPTVRLWYSKQHNNNASASNDPPLYGASSNNTNGSGANFNTNYSDWENNNWMPVGTDATPDATPTDITLVDDLDEIRLPNGVGQQLIVEQLIDDSGDPYDTYVRVGIIVFDAQGRMSFDPVRFQSTSPVGRLIQMNSGLQVNLRPALGVVLYDQTVFRSRNFSEGDYLLTSGAQVDYFSATPGALLTTELAPGREADEENWLDQNTVPLLINRFSGSLVRTE